MVAMWLQLCAGGVGALLLFVAYKLQKHIRRIKNSTIIVEGRAMPRIVSQEKLQRLRTEFTLRRDDVFIVSYPKSGTTWVQQIVRLVRGKGVVDDGAKITDAIPWLEGLEMPGFGSKLTLEDLECRQGPRTFKTHLPSDMIPGLPLQTSPAKYIYVVRNPKDIAVSLYTFSSHLLQLSSGFSPLSWSAFLSRFLNGKLWYGKWCEHVLGWWAHRDTPNVLFLKYEDMKKDLPAAVRKVAEFLEQDLEDDVIGDIASQCTFKSMQVNPTSNYDWTRQKWADGYKKRYRGWYRLVIRLVLGQGTPELQNKLMMRKGVVGDWRNHFTAKQSSEFDRAYADKMKCVGLEFD